MNKIICFLVMFFSGLIPLQAVETDPTLFYGTVGGGYQTNDDLADATVSFGLGGRYRPGYFGVDLSVNGLISPVNDIEGSLSVKALALFYPLPYERHTVYFGLGGGYGCQRWNAPNMVSVVWGENWVIANVIRHMEDWGFLSGEFVMGCEFYRDKQIKPFVQFGISQPVVYLHGYAPRKWTPTFTFSVGIGW